MKTQGEFAKLGSALSELAADQSEWSQKTFGSDIERGPVGALKHLEKEAREAQASPGDESEYADCLLLLLDASRRAGITPSALIAAGQKKMQVNKKRKWPKTVGDVPTEHVR